MRQEARLAGVFFFSCMLTVAHHVRLQVLVTDLPVYSNYSDALQPVDDALVQRVVLEYWAAFSAAAAEHDIAKTDFTKAFRDK